MLFRSLFVITIASISNFSFAEALFQIRADVQGGDYFNLNYYDLTEERGQTLPFIHGEVFDVAVTLADDQKFDGVVLSSTSDSAKVAELPRIRRRGFFRRNFLYPYERCLTYADKDYLCFKSSDLADQNATRTILDITYLPGWVMYTKPVTHRFFIDWSRDGEPLRLLGYEGEELKTIASLTLKFQLKGIDAIVGLVPDFGENSSFAKAAR